MMPKKQRREALFSALSEKAREKNIVALEKYEVKEAKTKDFNEMLKKIGLLPKSKSLLVVMGEKNEAVQKSSKNIPKVKTILANYLNIHDISKFKKVLIMKDAVKVLEETFLSK